MGQALEYIKIAIMNIRSNRGRSFLTMLGIIIGIMSVIMVISVGNGVHGQINGELDSLAGGQIYIYADDSKKDSHVTFDEDDFEFLRKRVAGVKGVTFTDGAWGTVEGRKGNFDATINFGNPDYQYIGTDPIIKGHYFTQADFDAGNLVAVVNESTARSLFGTTDVIGLSFDLDIYSVTQNVRIVGIRKDNASKMLSMIGATDMLSLEMPITAEAQFDFYTDETTSFYIVADDPRNSKEVASKAITLLESRKGVRGKNVIKVQNFADYTSQFDQILNYITLFVSMVAAISLLVGGIGVMNIMLVSVTERTREIGIRKSLGARTGSIMLQFLAEAGIITMLGGIIGIILGLAGGSVVCTIIGFAPSFDPAVIAGATLFSTAVGIFFGIYPARKAAKLSPIEALRHE